MKKITNILGKFLSIVAVIILIAQPVFAGSRMPAGTVLDEEAYVFTVDEAEEIMQTIQGLEETVKKQEELIELHKELDKVNQQQEVELEALLDVRQEQITAYEEWVAVDAERIKSLEKQKKFVQLERWGFFVLGIVVTGGAVIAADRLDDHVLENN